VRAALDADEREVRVAVERVDKVGGRDQRGDAGKVLVEEGRDEGARAVGFEVFVERGRGEEGACEGAVLEGLAWDTVPQRT
jgi:hypothetical protein